MKAAELVPALQKYPNATVLLVGMAGPWDALGAARYTRFGQEYLVLGATHELDEVFINYDNAEWVLRPAAGLTDYEG